MSATATAIPTVHATPSERAPVLEACAISVGYGPIPVIRNLDLVVAPGEIVALLGANGAGKTTTLMALAGLLAPSEGVVKLHGRPTHGPLHARVREGMAYVPEQRGVFRKLTTLENLRLGRGDPDAAMTLMPELRELLPRQAGLLSGGQQQMLSVARALAAEPAVLLCDELSLGLAPLIVHRLLEAIRAAAKRGVGVLLVEQHVRATLSVADRAYVLRRGSIVMSGTAQEVGSRLDEIESSYLSAAPADERKP
jgi:branched-chain amino acid transport system ATP-binding protein